MGACLVTQPQTMLIPNPRTRLVWGLLHPTPLGEGIRLLCFVGSGPRLFSVHCTDGMDWYLINRGSITN